MVFHQNIIKYFVLLSDTRVLQPVVTCCQSPYLRPIPSATKPAIIIMTSFSL